MEKYNIEGHVDLARDRQTSAIVNVNSIEYQHYVASRDVKKSKNERVNTMEEDLDNLKVKLVKLNHY